MRFTYGFYFAGRTYGWKNKELYRMHTLRKLKPQTNQRGKTVYLIDNKPKSLPQLEALTTRIDFVVKKISSSDTPF